MRRLLRACGGSPAHGKTYESLMNKYLGGSEANFSECEIDLGLDQWDG